MKKLLFTFSLLCCMTLIIGCGPKRPDGMPDLVDCVITIQNQDGSPLEKAIVSLVPQDTNLVQWSISGSTNEAGVATIMTNGEFPGAPVGKYKVTVQKLDVFDTGKKDEFGPITEARIVSNKKYATVQVTPLAVEVAGEPIAETFKLDAAE